MTTTVEGLKAAVARQPPGEKSASRLMRQIADLIKAKANEPDALLQLASELRAEADALAAAITENPIGARK